MTKVVVAKNLYGKQFQDECTRLQYNWYKSLVLYVEKQELETKHKANGSSEAGYKNDDEDRSWLFSDFTMAFSVMSHMQCFVGECADCVLAGLISNGCCFQLWLAHLETYTLRMTWKSTADKRCMYTGQTYPNGPEAGREAGWGSEFVPLKKRQAGSFILLHKISRTACCFGIRTFLKQYSCYESATNWYTDHQYLAQYSDIINNLQEIPLIFCNYAVRSCGTWRKGPGQSPCNGLSISDLELYVTETSTGVCDPVTD